MANELQAWLDRAVGRICYDRSAVAPPFYRVDDRAGAATVSMPTQAWLRDRFSRSSDGVRGICREIAAWSAARLEQELVGYEASVVSAIDPGREYHYMTAVTDRRRDRRYVIDLGYSQPVLVPVPDPGVAEDARWAPASLLPPVLFGGPVRYSCEPRPDGARELLIRGAGRDGLHKPFTLRPLTDSDDTEIMTHFFRQTGRTYRIDIVDVAAQGGRTAFRAIERHPNAGGLLSRIHGCATTRSDFVVEISDPVRCRRLG